MDEVEQIAERCVGTNAWYVLVASVRAYGRKCHREGAEVMRERAAKQVEGFRTGGPDAGAWTAWGETLAASIRNLPVEERS